MGQLLPTRRLTRRLLGGVAVLVTVVQVRDVRVRVDHRFVLMPVHVPAREVIGMLVIVMTVVIVGVLVLVVHRSVLVLMHV